jgi:Dna[CI] antecedent, DciA
MKRSDRGSSIKVGSLLKKFLEQHPAFTANPIGDWKDLVGEQVARYTSPKSLKNKVLVIVAHDSVWKHHIEQYKEVLAEKINDGRPERIVEKIVIKVAEIPDSMPVLNPAHKNLEKIKARRYAAHRKPKAPARQLTPEEQSLIKNLPDPDLRKIGAKLLKRIQTSKAESEQS